MGLLWNGLLPLKIIVTHIGYFSTVYLKQLFLSPLNLPSSCQFIKIWCLFNVKEFFENYYFHQFQGLYAVYGLENNWSWQSIHLEAANPFVAVIVVSSNWMISVLFFLLFLFLLLFSFFLLLDVLFTLKTVGYLEVICHHFGSLRPRSKNLATLHITFLLANNSHPPKAFHYS